MDVAVRVEGLGKRYRVGRATQHETLAGLLLDVASAPVRNARRLRGLTHFDDDDTPDTFWALRNVGFELTEGEVLGVVGRNGAGKSTLLKILSRTVEPTEGRAELWGRSASLLEVGTGFHRDLTGRENVFLNGSILGMRRHEIRKRFDEIVEFAGVADFIDTPVKRYSSGMQLRLAFAVAAHLDADVLIADEVLAVGDAEFQRKCLGKMRDVATSGRTVIFVSHNKAAVGSLCTRAIWLENGRINADGPVDVVVDSYVRSIPSAFADRTNAPRSREGDGRARITNVRFVDEHGEPVESFSSGQDAEIHVAYETAPGVTLRNAHATVIMHTSLGEPVSMSSSLFTGDELPLLPPRGRLVCRLPRLALNTGEYVCDVALIADGRKADVVRDAAVFAVEALDFYASGRHPDPAYGPLLLENEWRLEADEAD
jgi:lipopolysaccharide transport system ATP-binding protein